MEILNLSEEDPCVLDDQEGNAPGFRNDNYLYADQFSFGEEEEIPLFNSKDLFQEKMKNIKDEMEDLFHVYE